MPFGRSKIKEIILGGMIFILEVPLLEFDS